METVSWITRVVGPVQSRGSLQVRERDVTPGSEAAEVPQPALKKEGATRQGMQMASGSKETTGSPPPPPEGTRSPASHLDLSPVRPMWVSHL